METLKLENGDLVIENGDFVMTDHDIEQSAYIILKSNKGEWFFNPDLGINRQNIIGKVTNQRVRQEVIEGLSQEPAIEIIDDLSIERKTDRTATISFRGVGNEGSVEGEVDV